MNEVGIRPPGGGGQQGHGSMIKRGDVRKLEEDLATTTNEGFKPKL